VDSARRLCSGDLLPRIESTKTEQGMAELLEALHRLQIIELKIARIRGEQESIERRINVHERKVRKLGDEFDANRLAIRERQMRIDALNLEVAARDESAVKHRAALAKAKTNKEYATILTAINTEKADNSKIESQVLELMEQNQALEKEAERIEAEAKVSRERQAKVEAELEAFLKRTRASRETLQADRDRCAAEINPSALSAFDRVAQRHDGEALVPVTKMNPRRDEFICSGCNMTIPAEMVSSLTSAQEIQYCNVCGRILYLETAAAK
jgi:predicted  nucleic acid-binding Zn-ribbon protein